MYHYSHFFRSEGPVLTAQANGLGQPSILRPIVEKRA